MKNIIITLLFGISFLPAFSQFYLQPSIGFSFSQHPEVSQGNLVIEGKQTVYKRTIKLSEGVHAGFGAGYAFKNNLFVEVSGQKSIYTKHQTSSGLPDFSTLDNYYYSGFVGETEYRTNMIQFSPLLGYRIQKNRFGAYIKAGPNFMKSTISSTHSEFEIEYVHTENGWKQVRYDIEWSEEYTGNLNVGFQSNLGFSFDIKKDLQLTIEYVTVSNNYVIKRGEITGYKVDGVNRMDEIDDPKFEVDNDDYKLNHSYIGFNIGVKYFFNCKE